MDELGGSVPLEDHSKVLNKLIQMILVIALQGVHIAKILVVPHICMLHLVCQLHLNKN